MPLPSLCVFVIAATLVTGCGRFHYELLLGTDAGDAGTGGSSGSGDAGGSGGSGGTSGSGAVGGSGIDSGGGVGGIDAGVDAEVVDAAADATVDAMLDAGVVDPLTCRAGCVCERYRGTRYMLCSEPLDKPSAQAACEAESMELVRITSTTEHTWLRWRTVQQGFGKFHLAATDLATEGTWVWDDGTAFWQGVGNGAPINGEFALWDPGEPNAFLPTENCSEVQTVRGWNDCVCDLGKPFVCKDTRVLSTGCGNGVVDVGERCDDARTSDYCSNDCQSFVCPADCSCFDANGRGYALCSVGETFRNAGILCGRFGMTLARIRDANIDSDFRGRATPAGLTEYWIGGFDIDRNNEWAWSDLTPFWSGTATGTPIGYAHFTSGAPSGLANNDCLKVLANGEWQDTDCTGALAYACERL